MTLMANDFRLETKAITFTDNSPVFKILVGVILLATTYFSLFHHLSERDFWSSHEARAAMDAASILEDNNFLSPKLYDGQKELQKPPLYYWLVAFISWLRDTTPDTTSVRLPSAISALLTTCLICWYLITRGKTKEAIFCFIFFLTCQHFVWASRIGRTDMLLTLLITIMAISMEFSKNQQHNQHLWMTTSSISLFLAILCKGLIGLVLGTGITLGVLALQACKSDPNNRIKSFLKKVNDSRIIFYWSITLLIASTTFYIIDVYAEGEFLKTFLGYHHFTRALGNGTLRSHPIWYYFFLSSIDFLPWTPLIIFLALLALKSKSISETAQIGAIWFLMVFAILSLASYKRSDYLLPAYPGMAIFFSCGLNDYLTQLDIKKRAVLSKIFLTIPPALSSIGWLIYMDHYLPSVEPFREFRTPAALVRDFTKEELVFFNIELHSLAFHCGKPIKTVVGDKDFSSCISDRDNIFIITTPKDFRELSSSHDNWKKVILFQREETEFSRPFVFAKFTKFGSPDVTAKPNPMHSASAK